MSEESLGVVQSRLPHALVVLYAAAIAYASLQPFGDGMVPLP